MNLILSPNKKLQLLVLLLISVNWCFGQIVVSGTISDDVEPLIGVNILLDGSSTGTVTDLEGKYSLRVPDKNAVLIFSYTGYESQTIVVGDQTTIDLTLATSGALLDEIVVVGYGSKKKSDLTGSIVSLAAKDFEAQPMTRIENALQGRSAGVQVSNSGGSPGNNPKIRIRGTTSITSSGDPLVVLDGVIGASFGSINPADIASMQVLKDASATALYGSRGANGVILISTKTGKSDQSQVTLSSSWGLKALPKKIDVVDGATYAGLVNEQLAVGGNDPAFDAESISALEASGGTDWQDEIYRNGTDALTQNYTLALSGKKDKVGYYISGNLVNNEGILLNNHYDRYAFRSNIDFDINERMTAGFNVSYSREDALNGFISDLLFAPNASALIFDPTSDPYQEDGITPTKFSTYGSIAVSPLASALGRKDQRNTNNVAGTIFLNYKITDDLTYNFTGGLRETNATNTLFVANYATTGMTVASIFNSDFTQFQHTHILEYAKTIGRSDFSIKGVFEEQTRKSFGTSSQGTGLLVETVEINNIGFAGAQVITSGQSESAIRSYMGRAEYEFDNKYLFTGTVRVDGASQFSEDNKYSVFPSVAVAWRLSEEGFMKDLGIFDNLKIRASWGQVGNQAISPYSSFALLQFGPNFGAVLNDTEVATGVAPGRIANPDLKWETTTQYDIGLDMGFVNGRYRLSFDYYKKNTNDLLLNLSIPTFTGLGSRLQNVGEIENTGFEIEAGALAVNKKDFTWDIGFNIAKNKTEVLDIGNNDAIFPGSGFAGSGSIVSRVEVGGELGNFLGYINEGTWQTSEADAAAVYGLKPGDTKYRDLNNDNQINSEDVTIIGNGAPDFVWGLNNTLTYKNFELNIFLQAMTGQDVFNIQRAIMLGTSGDVKTPTHGDILDRWTPENQDTDIPAFSGTNFQVPEDSRFVEDASFIRLRNVRLGYTFSPDMLGDRLFKGLTVFVSGQNILTFTDYKGYDPEVSGADVGGGRTSNVNLGIDNGTYPNPRVITFGLNAIF